MLRYIFLIVLISLSGCGSTIFDACKGQPAISTDSISNEEVKIVDIRNTPNLNYKVLLVERLKFSPNDLNNVNRVIEITTEVIEPVNISLNKGDKLKISSNYYWSPSYTIPQNGTEGWQYDDLTCDGYLLAMHKATSLVKI